MNPRRTGVGWTVALALLAAPATLLAQAAPPPAAPDAVLQGAERLGAGSLLAAYRKGASSLVALAPATLSRPLIWYTEVVGVPAGMVANDGLGIIDTMVRLERVGGVVQVRDLGTAQRRRAAPVIGEAARVPGSVPGDAKRSPIEVALHASEVGPVIASFPIVGQTPDGGPVVDVTGVFSTDIPGVTARKFVAASGLVPAAVDPTKSQIERVRVRGDVLNIRSHLTFLAAAPAAPALGPRPVSIVLGHSLVVLPERPMAPRFGDPRVGFFPIEYTEFEPERGTAQARRSLVSRFRLEKPDPAVPVSDPVRPITYVLGRGIPDRWKPAIRAGVLQWLPVFEAAGFSNAIRVVDAPTPTEDPDWTPEDVSVNVIRWVTEERVNAMGPHVSDPRSGETLSAHIQLWPTVVDGFGQYYWAMFGGGVDPAAARLPLPLEKSKALLSYVVAHEVGHTLGLMHNHIASTAYSVAQMRNPDFANRHGPNSSIMAYGRFNQAAQPGDGVTQLWSVIGPYDYAAIRYGYGVFGTDPASEQRELAAFADGFSRDRRLFWGTAERGDFYDRFGRDPRVLTENTGAERVEATRLGVANLLRSLERLDAATAGDAALFTSTYDAVLGRHLGLLKSVGTLVSGVMPPLGAGEGPTARLVPAAEQRAAVRYLLGPGAASLQPYAAPALVERVAVYGGYRAIDDLQGSLVAELVNGPTVASLESQARRDAAAYSSLDLGRDVAEAVWSPLGASTTPLQRALQRGFVDAAARMLRAWADGGSGEIAQARAAQAQLGLSPATARLLVETGDDTVFVPWLRRYLTGLQGRLDTAARAGRTEADQLHYVDMSARVARLVKAVAP